MLHANRLLTAALLLLSLHPTNAAGPEGHRLHVKTVIDGGRGGIGSAPRCAVLAAAPWEVCSPDQSRIACTAPARLPRASGAAQSAAQSTQVSQASERAGAAQPRCRPASAGSRAPRSRPGAASPALTLIGGPSQPGGTGAPPDTQIALQLRHAAPIAACRLPQRGLGLGRTAGEPAPLLGPTALRSCPGFASCQTLPECGEAALLSRLLAAAAAAAPAAPAGQTAGPRRPAGARRGSSRGGAPPRRRGPRTRRSVTPTGRTRT